MRGSVMAYTGLSSSNILKRQSIFTASHHLRFTLTFPSHWRNFKICSYSGLYPGLSLRHWLPISRFDLSCAQARWFGSKPIHRVMQLKLHKPTIHCERAHNMSIRPIQLDVTLYLGQNRSRKPRCRIGLFNSVICKLGLVEKPD